jgi:PAS domain S-box-containing protein
LILKQQSTSRRFCYIIAKKMNLEKHQLNLDHNQVQLAGMPEKPMNDAIRDSALLQAVMDAAVDAVIVSDASGQIFRANPAACRMFQYDNSQLVGQNVKILMPKALADIHDEFILHHRNTGEKRIIGLGRDVEGQRKDLSVFPLHLSVGNAEVQGKPMFIGILHDLTQRKATQDALSRSQRLDAIGQMTGGIAHDFNNLLTVVIGNLELLEMRGATERQLPLIKDALDSAELGAELTERLMIFARKGNLKPVKANLADVCEETLKILKRTFGASIRIKTDFAPNLASVMIDPTQLQTALMNIAFNARDAMGTAGELLVTLANIEIDETYSPQETDIVQGRYIRLSINDNGTGMSEDAQKRVFEPFFTTKSESGGTGLGLAMVYGFVRQSGGHITLYSELGIGTNFSLYFPSSGEVGVDDTPHEHRYKPDTLPLGHGETVLVVEDNPKVRKVSIERIRDLGYCTQEARNGDQAYLKLIDEPQIDILFSDLVMPGTLNGYELATKAKQEFPNLKILLTSGYANDIMGANLGDGDRYDILQKPYNQAELAHRLHALLAGDSEG